MHGSFKGLKQCLERSKFDYENDTLIQLGDVADGWPEVPECVEELLKIKNLIAIRGNHDDWTHTWLKTGSSMKAWINQGGKATFNAYLDRPQLMIEHEQRFFSKQHNYYIDDKNRAFMHAGFNSRKGVGHEAYPAEYYWDRDMWQLALMLHKSYSKGTLEDKKQHSTRFLRHHEVYIGHTSTGNWNAKGKMPEMHDPNQKLNGPITVPMNRCNVWNMDTGGGFEGKVTIMDIDTKEYWQSDLCEDLYPDHQGR